MKYSYIALNQEHQKLTGTVSAETESEARDKLHEMSLSVISLKEGGDDTPEETTEGIVTFVFHAVDTKGTHTKGTIDARSRKMAFYRLISEYNFVILSLCENSISVDIQEEKGAQGLEELAEEVEEEFGVVQNNPLDALEDDSISKKNEAYLDAKKELIENVEEIVERAEKVLEKFEEKLTGDEYNAIKVKIDSLMRLRLSNNLKYIQDLADELLILVDITLQQHTDISEEDKKAHSFKKDGEEVELENGEIELSRLKKISRKMKKLLGGYKGNKKKKKKKKEEKKKETPFVRTRLIARALRKAILSLKRAALSKNSSVRKRHIKQMVSHVKDAKHIIETPRKKLDTVAKKLDEKDKIDQEEEKKEREYTRRHRKSNVIKMFQEFHLFFGWLLAFYIAYFYFSTYVLIKWGASFALFPFLHNSLGTPFPFLITGCLFLIFLGITLSLRFTRGKVLGSSIFTSVSFFLVALFLINF